MQMTVTILGSCTVTLTGDKHQDLWEQAAFFHSLPHTCPFQLEEGKTCGAPLIITSRQPKNSYIIYGLLCQGEQQHECNLSEYTDRSGLFYRGNIGKNAFKPTYGAQTDHRLDEQEQVIEPATSGTARTEAHADRDGAAPDKSAGDGWNCSPKNRKQVLSLWESAIQLGASETDLRRMLGEYGCTSRKELTDDQALKFAGELAALVREKRAAKGAGAR